MVGQDETKRSDLSTFRRLELTASAHVRERRLAGIGGQLRGSTITIRTPLGTAHAQRAPEPRPAA